MKKIKKIEKVTSVYSGWKPSDIAFVKALEWSVNDLSVVVYCQLRNINKWPDMSKEFFEVSILFKNISNLKLDFNGAGLHQVSGFDILDISDNGLEGINFQIDDIEKASLSFYCEEIEIKEIFTPRKVMGD